MLRERPYHASGSTRGRSRLKLQRQVFLWPTGLLIVPEVYEERRHWSKLRSVPVPQRGFSHRTPIVSKEGAFTLHDDILKRKLSVPSQAKDEDQGRSRHPRARARESSVDWVVRFRLPLSCCFCLSPVVQSQSSSPLPTYSPSSCLLRTFVICVYTHRFARFIAWSSIHLFPPHKRV